MRPIEELAGLLESERYQRKTLADGSGVVLDMTGMRILSLNPTGMFILDEIAGGATRPEAIVRRLTETFDVDRETAARDLPELIEELDRLLTAPS